ncbi:hypothetical protein [Sporisorium scitamineum]|nr:hypothetical protein [Sporisorium scitamineum]
MESINEEELRTIRHDLLHKRAVDTDAAKDHQVQRRAGSSTSSDVDASTIPPLRTLRYPGERIVLTEYNGELIVNVLDPQQVMWYQNTPWSQLSDARKQQLESFLLEQSSKGNNIEKAQDTSDRSKWFVDPEKPEEDIEIKNIGNKMWFQRHVNSRAHEPVEFDGLPEHLKHWIDNSPIKPIVEDAKLKIQEAAKEAADTGPHIRKRAISDREDSEKALRPRAGTGSVPNSTPGEVGTSSAPQGNEVTAQRRRFGWLKTIVTGKSSSSSSSKAFAREPLGSRVVEFPGSGISFSLAKHGEVLFWHSRGFEEDTMMFKNFDQLNEKEKELVTNSQLFQDFTSKLKTAEVYDGSYDATKTVLWPDKGEEKIIQTDWGDKYMYTRQTLKGEPLGEKPFYLLHELPCHLLEFVKTKLPEASKPHIRKRADSDEVMPTAEKVKFT